MAWPYTRHQADWQNGSAGGTPITEAAMDNIEAGILSVSDLLIPDTLLDAKGDLIVASAADVAARLAVGTNDQVLVADSAQATGVKWAALPGGAYIPVATVDAKGDLIVASAADVVGRLAVGANDQVLTADSAQALGVKWAAAAAAGVSVQGKSFAELDVVSTAAETDIVSETGITLTSTGGLRLSVRGSMLYNNVATETLQLKLKLGATTLIDTGAQIVPEGLSAERRSWEILVLLGNRGATNSQIAHWRFNLYNDAGTDLTVGTGSTFLSDTGAAAMRFSHSEGFNTSTEDLSVAKTLAVTAKWSVSSVNNSFKRDLYLLEKF